MAKNKEEIVIRNIKNRLAYYTNLIEYLSKQITIAHEQLDHSRHERITKALEDLQEHFKIYQDYLHEKQKLNKSDLKTQEKIQQHLHTVNDLLAIPKSTAQRIRKFSDESEIAPTNDEAKKIVEKFLSDDTPARGAALKPAGGISIGPDTPDQNKSTAEFTKAARVNLLKFDNGFRFVSVQQTENNSYKSTFHMNAYPDTSRQLHLGYTLPNDDLLKIAIAEVQNFRAGNPDLSRRMHLVGNMPKELVEAIALYCQHKGFPYVNNTIHTIELSSAQKAGYRGLLKHSPEKYLVDTDNVAALESAKKITKHTTRTKIDKEPDSKPPKPTA